jgi:hypothetical protein
MLGFLRYGVIKRIFDWDIFFHLITNFKSFRLCLLSFNQAL